MKTNCSTTNDWPASRTSETGSRQNFCRRPGSEIVVNHVEWTKRRERFRDRVSDQDRSHQSRRVVAEQCRPGSRARLTGSKQPRTATPAASIELMGAGPYLNRAWGNFANRQRGTRVGLPRHYATSASNYKLFYPISARIFRSFQAWRAVRWKALASSPSLPCRNLRCDNPLPSREGVNGQFPGAGTPAQACGSDAENAPGVSIYGAALPKKLMWERSLTAMTAGTSQVGCGAGRNRRRRRLPPWTASHIGLFGQSLYGVLEENAERVSGGE